MSKRISFLSIVAALVFGSAPAGAVTATQSISATATVSLTATLTSPVALACGTVNFNTTACSGGTGYAAGSVVLNTNSVSWSIALNDGASGATLNQVTFSNGGATPKTFTAVVSASPASGTTTQSNATITVAGGNFSGLNTTAPGGAYTGAVTVTVTAN